MFCILNSQNHYPNEDCVKLDSQNTHDINIRIIYSNINNVSLLLHAWVVPVNDKESSVHDLIFEPKVSIKMNKQVDWCKHM